MRLLYCKLNTQNIYKAKNLYTRFIDSMFTGLVK
nr:MAG TPA_asm: hypothetical protein [Caudoviricetes sp.]